MFVTMKAFQANTKIEDSMFYALEVQIFCLVSFYESFFKRMEFYIERETKYFEIINQI